MKRKCRRVIWWIAPVLVTSTLQPWCLSAAADRQDGSPGGDGLPATAPLPAPRPAASLAGGSIRAADADDAEGGNDVRRRLLRILDRAHDAGLLVRDVSPSASPLSADTEETETIRGGAGQVPDPRPSRRGEVTVRHRARGDREEGEGRSLPPEMGDSSEACDEVAPSPAGMRWPAPGQFDNLPVPCWRRARLAGLARALAEAHGEPLGKEAFAASVRAVLQPLEPAIAAEAALRLSEVAVAVHAPRYLSALRPFLTAEAMSDPRWHLARASLMHARGETEAALAMLRKLSQQVSTVGHRATVLLADLSAPATPDIAAEEWMALLDTLGAIGLIHAGTDLGAAAANAEADLSRSLFGSDIAVLSLALARRRGVIDDVTLDRAMARIGRSMEPGEGPGTLLPLWYLERPEDFPELAESPALRGYIAGGTAALEMSGLVAGPSDDASAQPGPSASSATAPRDWRQRVSEGPPSRVASRAERPGRPTWPTDRAQRGDVVSARSGGATRSASLTPVPSGRSDLLSEIETVLRATDQDLTRFSEVFDDD